MNRKTPAVIVLEDKSVWPGFSCGSLGEAEGEFVFNTAMTGYQEILTDPSYKNQIVVMSYPLIGNYGIIIKDSESERPFLSGFVVGEMCRHPSNWEMSETLESFLKRHAVVAIEGVDTRALILHLRNKGSLRGLISTDTENIERLKKKAKAVPRMVGSALASEVSCREKYAWNSSGKFHALVYDFGAKRGILRALAQEGFRVTVVPAQTSAQEALALNPDGIVLSNGPGDPEPLKEIIEAAKALIDSGKPLLGICLGHQILALALGAKTYKLKFGHHGSNHPVIDVSSRQVEITSQNHGFAVDAASLPQCVSVTHLSLNDQSCEGFSHKEAPIFSLQYHPEASAGPHDALKYFRNFREMVERKVSRI